MHFQHSTTPTSKCTEHSAQPDSCGAVTASGDFEPRRSGFQNHREVTILTSSAMHFISSVVIASG